MLYTAKKSNERVLPEADTTRSLIIRIGKPKPPFLAI